MSSLHVYPQLDLLDQKDAHRAVNTQIRHLWRVRWEMVPLQTSSHRDFWRRYHSRGDGPQLGVKWAMNLFLGLVPDEWQDGKENRQYGKTYTR